MKNTKLKKPTSDDLYDVMDAICSVPNVWTFCLPWQTKMPKTFNKFMDICAWWKNDESYLEHKVEDTEFMYHKGIKKDVLISKKSRPGCIKFWDEDTMMWANDKCKWFEPPKEIHN